MGVGKGRRGWESGERARGVYSWRRTLMAASRSHRGHFTGMPSVIQVRRRRALRARHRSRSTGRLVGAQKRRRPRFLACACGRRNMPCYSSPCSRRTLREASERKDGMDGFVCADPRIGRRRAFALMARLACRGQRRGGSTEEARGESVRWRARETGTRAARSHLGELCGFSRGGRWTRCGSSSRVVVEWS